MGAISRSHEGAVACRRFILAGWWCCVFNQRQGVGLLKTYPQKPPTSLYAHIGLLLTISLFMEYREITCTGESKVHGSSVWRGFYGTISLAGRWFIHNRGPLYGMDVLLFHRWTRSILYSYFTMKSRSRAVPWGDNSTVPTAVQSISGWAYYTIAIRKGPHPALYIHRSHTSHCRQPPSVLRMWICSPLRFLAVLQPDLPYVLHLHCDHRTPRCRN